MHSMSCLLTFTVGIQGEREMLKASVIYLFICPLYIVAFASLAALCFIGSLYLLKSACAVIYGIGLIIHSMWTGDILNVNRW